MAEIATLARPYAEALFKAAGAEAGALKGQVATLAALAADPVLKQFADNPQVSSDQVFDVVAGVALLQGVSLSPKA
ncbi:MAG: F0F1 ATP synthase subunit delta, partial [Betaproteobacteria bacterium]